MKLYGQFVVEMNGETMAETTSLEFMGESDDQDVFTLLKGFAGQSASPRKLVLNLTDVIPNTDSWHTRIWEAWFNAEEMRMRIWRVADVKSLASQGFIRKPKGTSGVGKASEMAYEFHGEANTWV